MLLRHTLSLWSALLATGIVLAQPSEQFCPGDLTDDNKVNLSDLAVLLGDFGCNIPVCVGDINGDGVTDLTDLAILLGSFGTDCCPGDANDDDMVDLTDMALVLAEFGCTTNCQGDIDGDGDVDLEDLAIVLGNFGLTCEAETMGVVDLDIDSDNDDGTASPDRSQAEDDIEAAVGTGKLFLVNDDDDDFDGIVDFDEVGPVPEESDDLVPIVLELSNEPAGVTAVTFKLQYDQNAMRVWNAPTRGSIGVDDIPDDSEQEYVLAGGPLTFWVEGLQASVMAGDAPISAVADFDDDGSFESEDLVLATELSVSSAPQVGQLGTLVTWMLAPAIAPAVFDATTTASWTGKYQPPSGNGTAPFSFDYTSAQLQETSTGTASILLGDGTPSQVPDPAALIGGGVLQGQITFQFNAFQLRRSMSLMPQTEQLTVWRTVLYAAEPNQPASGSPLLGQPATELSVYEVPPTGVPTYLATAFAYHFACTVIFEENPASVGSAPSSIVADVVTLDPQGLEHDRHAGIVLTLDSADNDPAHLTYVSDLSMPIVFVDGAFDETAFPTLITLLAVEDGRAIVVPGDPP